MRRKLAVKVLPAGLASADSLLRRFEQEQRILAHLDHPNIAKLLDSGRLDDGSPFLAMEWVDGEQIDAYCARKHLSVEERLRLFIEVCAAVQAAHRALVVHRDLKPSNIFVTAEGAPKLLDFGIAKPLDPELADTALTRGGGQPLTPRYASPEQIRGEPVATTSDVYALGVLLYELLSGTSPYGAANQSFPQLIVAICDDDPSPPSAATAPSAGAGIRRSDIGPDLDAIVLKALHKEPSRRYASVEALGEDLRCYLEGRPVAARNGNTAYLLVKFFQRHRWSVSAAAGIALLLIGWTLSLRYQLAQTEKERLQAERARELLVEVVGGSDPASTRGRELTAKEVLDRATARVRARADDPAELRASLLASLGRVYLSLGLLDQAEPLLVDALTAGMAPGPAHADERARSATALAQLRYQQGRAEESVELLRSMLAREGRHLDDGLRARMMSLLGRSLVERGAFAAGEATLREALAIGRRAPQTSRAELVECLVNLGLVIASRRPITQRQEAEAFLLEAIAMAHDHSSGPDRVDPMLLENALEDLAWIYLDAGDWRRAESLVAEAEAIGRENLADDHPSLLDLRNYRAIVAWRKGDFAGAEATLQQVLDLHPELTDYPTYERLRGNLGAMQILQGRFAEGEMQVRQALAAHRRSGTVGWADIFYDLWILAFSAYDRGDLQAAWDFADQAVRESGRLPPGMPYLPLAHLYRGASSSWLDGAEAGEKDLRLAVEAQAAVLPADHPDRVAGLAELAAALLRRGQLDEAETLAREAARVAASLPDFHWERAWALAVAAAVELEHGDPNSRSAIEQQLPLLEHRHGPMHPRVMWLRQRLDARTRTADGEMQQRGRQWR